MSDLQQVTAGAVGLVGRWLADVYALDLEISPEEFVLALSPGRARELLPPGSRSGVLVAERGGELHLGLHLSPEDSTNEGTLVEETSHLICIAWHAARDLPISRLVLELQADVDRFVFARLASGRAEREALIHFHRFEWAEGLEPEARDRYQLAHARAHRYCTALARHFPRRADTPALLSELRRFYRASPDTKLRAAA